MVQKTYTVTNKTGLHARPASMLVQAANSFQSSIKLRKTDEDKWVDAKSIMSIMLLGVFCGDSVVFEVSGSDENEAVDKITSLFNENFGEA